MNEHEDFLPYNLPDISEAEIEAVVEVLRSGWLAPGPRVRAFEEDFAALAGTKHAIALDSATAGMHLALIGLGIGPGDEVITTPFSFFATAEMIVLVGATPVFVDIDALSFNIDPAKIEAAVTPRTSAIMPVSLYGQCADFDAINAIAGPSWATPSRLTMTRSPGAPDCRTVIA